MTINWCYMLISGAPVPGRSHTDGHIQSDSASFGEIDNLSTARPSFLVAIVAVATLTIVVGLLTWKTGVLHSTYSSCGQWQ